MEGRDAAQWQSACLALTRPWFQSIVLKKNKSQKGERECHRKIFEEIMTKNSPDLVKDKNLKQR
jgi:hypothetical protein